MYRIYLGYGVFLLKMNKLTNPVKFVIQLRKTSITKAIDCMNNISDVPDPNAGSGMIWTLLAEIWI